ncbi:hypothetical protein ACFQBS_35590 [Planomonospora parontospora]|uniref:hypothetical protein n=1 Tax=Planomonospora parontospora TaxID=58119 RepID=UPI00361AD0A0
MSRSSSAATAAGPVSRATVQAQVGQTSAQGGRSARTKVLGRADADAAQAQRAGVLPALGQGAGDVVAGQGVDAGGQVVAGQERRLRQLRQIGRGGGGGGGAHRAIASWALIPSMSISSAVSSGVEP